MTLKAVAFDLWETLITDTEELSDLQQDHRRQALGAVLRAHELAHTDQAIQGAHHAIWAQCHALYWSQDRDIPTRVQVEHFVEALGLQPGQLSSSLLLDLEEAYSDAPLRILPAAVPYALETVASLAARGMEIGLVSNTGRTPGRVLRKVLDALGFGPFLSTLIFSNEVGECKPRPAIFAALAQGMSSAPAETVFVGDNLYCDVWGAQRAGMLGVHFVPARRGTAVGVAVDHGLTIRPDGVIDSLHQLPSVIEQLIRDR